MIRYKQKIQPLNSIDEHFLVKSSHLIMFMFALLLYSVCSANASENSVTSERIGGKFPQHQREKLPVHRLVIIDALSKRQTAESRSKWKAELNKELTWQLLRNSTTQMETTELALWISALIAAGENPRNFNSLDLVADLLHRVNKRTEIHPFLVLTLCNARALHSEHLLTLIDTYPNTSTAMLALYLKALACASTLQKFENERLELQSAMERIAATLAAKQSSSGDFGDIYATSLAIQALTAYGKQLWDEDSALDILQKEDEGNNTIVKAYYVNRAFSARKVKFLKDLYSGSYEPGRMMKQTYIYVHISINFENTGMEFSLTLRVPNNWTLFHIMKRAETISDSFRFSFTKAGDELILVEVSDIPNDHEKNLIWFICTNRKNEEVHTLSNLYPFNEEEIKLWYRSEGCPT